MGYGGGSVSVNLGNVQLDFEALIDGLCGPANRTLTDITSWLITIDGRLFSGGQNAAGWLASILDCLTSGPYRLSDWVSDIWHDANDIRHHISGPVAGALASLLFDTDTIKSALYGGYGAGSVADMLFSIHSILADVWDYENHRLRVSVTT